jgi:hypothetical protein
MSKDNYTQLTDLAVKQQQQSIYDGAKTPQQTAGISAANNKLYAVTGGNKKKGGYYPKWGCMSGGRKRTKKAKGRKNTKKYTKNRRTNRRK